MSQEVGWKLVQGQIARGETPNTKGMNYGQTQGGQAAAAAAKKNGRR